MKKKIKVLFGILLAISVIFAGISSIRADSGWDGDYGNSGGSTGGYSGGWSTGGSSSSSSGSSSGGHYLIPGDVSPVFVIIAFIILLIYVCFMQSKESDDTSVDSKSASSGVPKALAVEEIKQILPDFDYSTFKSQVFDIYKNIQTAWMDFDYETLRKLTTDELYNTYHSELVALKLKKQKNVMQDFEMVNFSVTDIESNDKSVSLKVRTTMRCKDYVATEDGQVVRGTDSSRVTYDYEMTFIKGLSQKDNKCPNCNAPLDNVQSAKCPYCDSTIVGENHDWVLSKKQVIKQRR